MNYILDTNVISELVAARPNANVVQWIESIDPDHLYMSVIAIGELKKGIEKLPKSSRKEVLDHWLHEELLVRFQDHILPIDTNTILIWGTLNARLEAEGQPISAVDALIAATTEQYQSTLVTRNTSHFENTGIQLENPWNR